MEIRSLIVCPACKGALSQDFSCPACRRQYTIQHGVYNTAAGELSDEYAYSAWNLTDEDVLTAREKQAQFRRVYDSYLNAATLAALRRQDECMRQLAAHMHGLIVDIATGRGQLLEVLLPTLPADARLLCTDIDAKILAITRKGLGTADDRVAYLATDGCSLAITDRCADYVTSFAGLSNMPDTERVLSEIHRILKPGGKFYYKGVFIQPGSASHALAQKHGLGDAMILPVLTGMMARHGFDQIALCALTEAVWSENPCDLLPVAGDTAQYCIICAQKK